MKKKKQKSKNYQPPSTIIVEVESSYMLAISGDAPDSDDSEFSASAQRRGTWGNLWSE